MPDHIEHSPAVKELVASLQQSEAQYKFYYLSPRSQAALRAVEAEMAPKKRWAHSGSEVFRTDRKIKFFASSINEAAAYVDALNAADEREGKC